MMFDFLMAWANDEKLRSEGVVAFIGADDKAFCSDQSIILSPTEKKPECKSIGNDGVREAGGAGKKPEEEKENNKEQFQDEGDCFSWEGTLVWNPHRTSAGCTEWNKWKNEVQVGQMYGLSKGASGFKKLKGLVVHV